MNKHYLIVSLLFLMATSFLSVPLFSQSHSYPFQSGENMELVIHYKWGFNADIAAVNFTFTEVKESGKEPYFHLVANASTYKFWDSFFKVRDLYESKFYSKDLSPLYFHRDVYEGGFTAENWYTWSNNGAEMRAIVDKKGRTRRDTTFNEGVIIRDIINLFYTMRTLDFNKLIKGEKAFFTIAIDRNVVDIAIRFDKKENKKIDGLGTFKTVKFALAVKPRDVDHGKSEDSAKENSRFDIGSIADTSTDETQEGVFYGEEKIYMWFSDDDNRLPLYFSAPVAVGSINGRISKYTGVKYPITSLISK